MCNCKFIKKFYFNDEKNTRIILKLLNLLSNLALMKSMECKVKLNLQ